MASAAVDAKWKFDLIHYSHPAADVHMNEKHIKKSSPQR